MSRRGRTAGDDGGTGGSAIFVAEGFAAGGGAPGAGGPAETGPVAGLGAGAVAARAGGGDGARVVGAAARRSPGGRGGAPSLRAAGVGGRARAAPRLPAWTAVPAVPRVLSVEIGCPHFGHFGNCPMQCWQSGAPQTWTAEAIPPQPTQRGREVVGGTGPARPIDGA